MSVAARHRTAREWAATTQLPPASLHLESDGKKTVGNAPAPLQHTRRRAASSTVAAAARNTRNIGVIHRA